MARTPFVGGNWKCNGTKASATELTEALASGLANLDGAVDVVIAPAAIHLSLAQQAAEASNGQVQVAAQNCSLTGNGAFTGELSCEMLTDHGIGWVILGHSERRAKYGETDQIVGDKVKRALEQGLKVIACLGEQLEERKAEQTDEVVKRQLKAIADNVSDWSRVVVAYEPVWAIGTGLVATPEQAQEVHASLREWVGANVASGADVAKALRIIYGGSVKPKNAADLFKKADVDGFLVGGASLKAGDFQEIIAAAH